MKTLKLAMLALLFPFCTFAWHSNGHMTAGAVAYYYLKANDPAVLNKVLATIKLHPWYSNPIWHDKLAGLTAEQQNVALFMLASTFPDDARDSARFSDSIRAKWHYIDYPFVPAGQTVTGEPPVSPNAEEKLREFMAALPHAAENSDKAVDVCWVFHLVEDVHQPLHSVSLFDAAHPHGDRGGNDTYIKFPSGNSAVKLHSYWDDLVKGTFANVPGNAQQLLASPKYKESQLTELQDTSLHNWIFKESFSYAKTTAYKNGSINGTKTQPTAVDNSYSSAATALGERRVVLAGIRLAKVLQMLYA